MKACKKYTFVSNMERMVIIVFGGIIVMMLILLFTPNDKIPLMGEFLEKVLPHIPISEIVGAFKK